MRFSQLLALSILVVLSFISTLKSQSDIHSLRVDLVYLASDYLEGRMTGEPGSELAAEYIADRFKEIGLKPYFGDNYFQEVECRLLSNPHVIYDANALLVKSNNVAGFIDNKADWTVVIGAHYDHIGRGGEGSLAKGSTEIHNGADDNASGVAALIHIAEKLYKSKLDDYNYLFIAFTGEELGLNGSQQFVNSEDFDASKVSFMLNMDMVGRLDTLNSIIVNGVGTSPGWIRTVDKANRFDLSVTMGDSGVGPSDHSSFYFKDIPALHVYTGLHTEYHKPSDDSHLINFQGIAKISDFLVQIISDLQGKPKLPFTKTKEEDTKKAAKFKVSLGVLPDYTSKAVGMKIDGVIDGRPAEKAGLEDGDIIIRMGEFEVKEIYSYMEALAKFKFGDEVEVEVMRKGEKVVKKVKFEE